jgi:propionyl-CoA synthetase
MQVYADDYRSSRNDPAGFWAGEVRAVDWFFTPRTILDHPEGGSARWFAGSRLNTCFNALDRQVIHGLADDPALVFRSDAAGVARTYSYAELLERVAQLGGALRETGVRAGDTVLVWLPPLPEAVMAMLACARIGAVHCVLPEDATAEEIAAAVDLTRPVVVIAASCGFADGHPVGYQAILDEALARTRHSPVHCVVLQRPQLRAALHGPRDIDLAVLMRPGSFEPAVCEEVAGTDALYVLWERNGSDPTAARGLVRDNGGHAVALTYAMRTVYGVGVGDVVLTLDPLSSAAAHSCLVYGPLLVGATAVMHEHPGRSALWPSLERDGVTVLVGSGSEVAAESGVGRDAPGGRKAAGLRGVFVHAGSMAAARGPLLDFPGTPIIHHWWPSQACWPVAAYAPDDHAGSDGLGAFRPFPGF